jgi:erythritol kinase
VVCGGGSRSGPWLQTFANVLGRPLLVAGSEVGARGAVIAALQATGRPVDVATWTAPERVIEPEPLAVTFYDEGYQDYLRRQSSARAGWQR